MTDLNRGVVNIHLGQCGVQTADSLWELYCLEHSISFEGKIKKNRVRHVEEPSNGIFFEECSNGKYVPRAVIFDTEPTAVDVIRTGRKRDLFRPDCLISGKEDSGNVFARGYFAMADDLRDLTLDRIRKVVEGCSAVQGFSLFRSYNGGTGSGFGSSLATALRDDYPKTTQIEIATVPSGQYATAVVEPYNAVFSTHESLMNSDCAIFFDNEALYNMMCRKLEFHAPSYRDINRMVAQIVSAMTAGIRFSSTLRLDFTELQTNLVPYPRLHFPFASISPILPRYIVKSKADEHMDTVKITKNLFNKHHFALMGDPNLGKYISCCIMYRGNIVPKEMNRTIHLLKRTRSIQFVDWCPTGFKIGINHARVVVPKGLHMEPVPTSAVMLANNTSIHEFWMILNKKYDLMKRKRCFWHHYIQEGMGEEDFTEFREDLAALELDYQEVGEDTIMADDDMNEEIEMGGGGDNRKLTSIKETSESGDLSRDSSKSLSVSSEELTPSMSV